jgi:hypothetical protein
LHSQKQRKLETDLRKSRKSKKKSTVMSVGCGAKQPKGLSSNGNLQRQLSIVRQVEETALSQQSGPQLNANDAEYEEDEKAE